MLASSIGSIFSTPSPSLPRFSSNSPSGGMEYYLVLIFPVITMPQVMLRGRNSIVHLVLESILVEATLQSLISKRRNRASMPTSKLSELTCEIGNLISSPSTQTLKGAETEYVFLIDTILQIEFERSTILCLGFTTGIVTHWQYYQWIFQTFHFTVIHFTVIQAHLSNRCTDPTVIITIKISQILHW